jgi:uncharacterized protein
MIEKVFKNTEIISLGLFFKKEKMLAIGDLHIGQEEELNNFGILVPRKNFKKIMLELDFIIKKTKKLNKIILLGDVKHEFGSANNQEWKEILLLIDFLEKNCKELIIIKGNHDNFITNIMNWKKINVLERFEFGDYCFCHGNKILKTKKEKIIIGHEHSAITLYDDYKKEKFKCIAKTIFEKKQVVVLPSFNFMSTGTDLLKEKLISPYLKNAKEFKIWILENRKNFYFGKMKKDN